MPCSHMKIVSDFYNVSLFEVEKLFIYTTYSSTIPKYSVEQFLFEQMSSLSLRVNIIAFPKVVQKFSLVAVLAFFTDSVFSGVTTRFVQGFRENP